MYKIIYDENEVKKFFDTILRPLQAHEVFFVSLSARNKYLTKEERQQYDLGRTVMFERRVIRYYDWERFLRTLRKFETNEGSYLTKTGKHIPQKCIICYININPSNVLKAYSEFSKTMADYLFELSICSIENRNTGDIMNRIRKMDTLLMNCYQKNRGTKHWIDIDFDIPKEDVDIVKFLTDEFYKRGIEYHIIDTHSGYHVLINKHTIHCNFHEMIVNCKKKMYYKYKDSIEWEIEINKNEMIPVPGTLQGNYTVRIL